MADEVVDVVGDLTRESLLIHLTVEGLYSVLPGYVYKSIFNRRICGLIGDCLSPPQD
jgi:hypothetical protein